MSDRYNPFPRDVKVEITIQLLQRYIKDEAFDDFLDYIAVDNPYILSAYLDHQEEDFTEWLLSGGGAQ